MREVAIRLVAAINNRNVRLHAALQNQFKNSPLPYALSAPTLSAEPQLLHSFHHPARRHRLLNGIALA